MPSKGLLFILIVFIVLSPLRLDKSVLYNYQAEGAGFFYISQDTVWKKTDNIVLSGRTIIDSGATLTIEKGAVITFAGEPVFLAVFDGRIIAEGTKEEKIVFKTPENTWNTFGIFFHDKGNNNPSFLRYVEFIRGGYYPSMLFQDRSILNRAHATLLGGAVEYYSGKVHIENSEFRDSFSAAVNINIYEDSQYPAGGYFEIANSNFQNSGSKIAVSSTHRCASSGCKSQLTFKNNWYGNPAGPAAGEKMAGDCVADGFRKSSLIADPAVIIPGIMGSAEYFGELRIDPIRHSYDDLLESLEKNGYEKNINLFEFPYDWRNNNEITANHLQSRIEGIINSAKISRVDLVAHSMGGLAARAYIEETADGTKYENTVDQLITLGTPHKGSPKAYLRWEAGDGFYGWEEKLAKHHFKNEAEHSGYDSIFPYIREKVTSVQDLLPDYDYLSENGTMRTYPDNYPRNAFLEDLNRDANLEKLKKVNFTNIIGVLDNNQSTISKVRVSGSGENGLWEHGMPENFDDTSTDQGLEYAEGDETVPIKSSDSVNSAKTIRIDAAHGDLPTEVQCLVLDELAGISESVCQKVDKWRIPNILLFNVFSPVDIQVVSPSGKRVGKDFTAGGVLNEIEGAYYSGFKTDNEFLTIPNPEDGEYKILTQGTGDGGYKIEAVKISENAGDPQKAIESVAEISGIAITGQTEESSVIVQGNEVIGEKKDTEAPIVTITSPENKEYLNDQVIPIIYIASDNKTRTENLRNEVSLDGAIIEAQSLDLSLQKLGTHSAKALAIDEAGNQGGAAADFAVITDINSTISNINHYADLGLIKDKKTKKYLLQKTKEIKLMMDHLEKIETTKNKKIWFMKKFIDVWTQHLDRGIGNLIQKIQGKKTGKDDDHKSNLEIGQPAKDLLIESLSEIKSNLDISRNLR